MRPGVILRGIGRYWNFWHILSPSYFNPGSVMFEVAACITLYVIVLWNQWFPTFLEWPGARGIQKAFEPCRSCSSALACFCQACTKARLARC